MNEAPMKQQDAWIDTPQAELSEPHFDEIAVLIAQPVEPIAHRERDWFAWLEKPRMMIAILVVAGLLGTTALALTLRLPRQRTLDSAATEIKTNEPPIKAAESRADADPPLGAIAEQLKGSVPRRRNRKADSSETKPVARRVGVIVYGSSSDRP